MSTDQSAKNARRPVEPEWSHTLDASKPATPLDLGLANATPSRDLTDLTATRDRAQNARDLLNLRCSMLEAVLADSAATPKQLRDALNAFSAFGRSVPPAPDEQLTNVGELLLPNARRNIQKATTALSGPLTADALAEAGQAIFGEGFWILPEIGALAAADLWTAALAAPPSGASRASVRRFLIDFAAVRYRVRQYVESMLLVEAIGIESSPQVAQLSGAYGVAPSGWVGGLLLDLRSR